MSKQILFNEAEVVQRQDIQAISEAAVEGDENLAGGAIGYPLHWADFTIETPSANRIRISDGRLFQDEKVFDLDSSKEIDLLLHLPTIIGDQRYVAILVRGLEQDLTEERQIEVDVETKEKVPLQVPKVRHRTCEFVVQQGIASPTPLKPEVADTNCAIAFVLLGTVGIISVEASQDHRVKTLYEVEGRVTVLEGQMSVAFNRTQTLQTDLANLQGQLKDYSRREVTRQLQMDVARVRRRLELPDAARSYFYDAGLVKSAWDTEHPLWLARVDEGIRFPFAQIRDSQLKLQNPGQQDIRITDDVVMLDWTETRRIDVDGSGSTKNISQQVHTVTTPVQRTVSRSSVSYGPTVAMCGNTAEYAGFDKAASGQTFQKGGETFEKVAVIDNAYAGSRINLDDFNASHGVNYDVATIALHNSQVGQSGNREIYAARSVQVDYWTETYWDFVTETFGINGSIYGQTFLLTQPLILTSIETRFDRIGQDGDVTMVLCETAATGEPVFDAVIAKTTVPHAALSSGWVRFEFSPRYLQPGKRYGWAVVTTGNHSMRTVTGSKYTQGSLFWITDGAWAQGSNEEDFCFRVNGTDHKVNRAQILFDPLALENGMTEIKLLYESWSPEGGGMIWEVRTSGSDEWESVQPETADKPNPLRGLPANCQLRLTMIGTSGLSPAILMNSNARGVSRRPRGDTRAITKILEFGLSTTAIDVELSVDMFDDALHTVTPKIMIGSTQYSADSITVSKDIAKAERRLIRADFTVPATTEARLIIEMQTASVQSVCFIENCSLFAA